MFGGQDSHQRGVAFHPQEDISNQAATRGAARPTAGGRGVLCVPSVWEHLPHLDILALQDALHEFGW